MVKTPAMNGAKLKALEDVLQTAQRWQFEEAKALRTIRDQQLYRATHQTFETYVSDRWGIDRTYAHRQCQWAATVEILLPIGNTPQRESHARPLYGLSEDQQRAAWSMVCRRLGGSRTAAAIADVTEAYLRRQTPQRAPDRPQRGRYSVTSGDAIESVAKLVDGKVGLFLFSPPYAEQRRRHYPGIPESDFPTYMAKLFSAMASKIAPNGSVLMVAREHVRDGQISDYLLHTRLAIRSVGWREIDTLIWHKPDAPPLGRADRPRRTWEHVYWFSNSSSPRIDTRACGTPLKESRARMARDRGSNLTHRFRSADRARLTDIVTAPIGNVPKGIEHSATFPPLLASQLIQTFAPEASLVADPFCGSGTTLVAAIQSGRNAWGNDILPRFAKMTRDRLALL